MWYHHWISLDLLVDMSLTMSNDLEIILLIVAEFVSWESLRWAIIGPKMVCSECVYQFFYFLKMENHSNDVYNRSIYDWVLTLYANIDRASQLVTPMEDPHRWWWKESIEAINTQGINCESNVLHVIPSNHTVLPISFDFTAMCKNLVSQVGCETPTQKV